MALPAHIQKYFWDIDPKKAQPKKHSEYYIKRIFEMAHKDERATLWLKQAYGAGKLSKAISNILSGAEARYKMFPLDKMWIEHPFMWYNTLMVSRLAINKYIIADSEICHGKPTFKGTRIMVWQVLELLASGQSPKQIVKVFPSLKESHVKAALSYASSVTREGYVILNTKPQISTR